MFFLLNNSDCKLRHDLVPVLPSIVKTNPVEKFIEEYFSKDNIVGYNVYNVTTKPSEIWNTLIVSSHYTPFLSTLLDHVLLNTNLKFGGMYFVVLELNIIIDKIINQIDRAQYIEHLQIFVCILQSSGIKLIVKHKGNIISIQTFDYPADKSDSYIQGIIEQEIADCLIESKNYIISLGLKVCIIIIVNEHLKTLLANSKFGEHEVISVTNHTLLGKHYINSDKFFDPMLVKLFNKHKNYPAYNKDLKIISKLNIFSSFVFKPLLIIIIGLVITLVVVKLKTLENYKKLAILNLHYSSVEQEYYNIKQKYPYIQNATNLADLYIFEALLQIPIPIPFDILENFVRSLPPSLILEGMKWHRLDLNNTLLSPTQYTETTIFLKFITVNTSIEDSIKMLKQQIADYTKIFGNMEISLRIFNDQIVNLSNRVVIPLSLIITKRLG
ncbi:hypothetical protein [Candidatus Tisiphia endosymbiont of Beris chalybata]|uniref:hypothetical protein n=1 Tax=Candidatus Tisiphia endosymbiont of Beris chalybata TaxID=3066262 RepID=UPI00312C8B28